MNGTHIIQTRQVKYLRLHLDTQLTWEQYTKSIIDKIRIKGKHMYWLTSRNSKLSIEDKLKIYKTIIKPIWTHGIPLWGTTAMSHINKLESLQSKVLKTIVNNP